ITGLASWLGLTISPIAMLKSGLLPDRDLITAGLVLGAALVVGGAVFHRLNVKRHFTFTYFLFGSQLLFVSTLAGLFDLHAKIIYVPLLVAMSLAGVLHAKREHSFIFVLMSTVYGYTGMTFLVGEVFPSMSESAWGL